MIPILMYHQVTEIPRKQDPTGHAVPPIKFDQQMSYLARNAYQCLTLPEAVQYFKKNGSPPAKTFVLTFDDGYQDILSRAYPIMEKYGFTATVFLVANRMGVPSNWWGQDGDRSGQLLSWAEARDLAQRGYILGSHTLTHPFLNLLDDQSAFAEIQTSRLVLQNELEMKVDLFSYPFSETDARIERLVESAGYTAACAGDSGPWGVFHLWRVPCLRDDTALSFALKVNGWYDKRTALRESSQVRLLRSIVRKFRSRQKIRLPNQAAVSKHDLDRETERRS
jgi:peptidoglycan/xylan/chitin deacetylase (PgdA/CDA1 family)